MAKPLKDRVAVVTGATRGIGKGIALELGEAGAAVYVTGRTTREGSAALPGSLQATVEQITRQGGQATGLRCDHRVDSEVEAAFRQIQEQQGRLDLLVNNVYATPDAGLPQADFWKLPVELWDQLHAVGLRSHYISSYYAVPIMIGQGQGLIINISSGGAAHYLWNVAYGAGKAGLDKMTADMAHELEPHRIAVISLWPPYTRTELVQARPDLFDASRAVSPRVTGRAVAALAADPQVLQKTGRILRVTELAKEYGFSET